MTKRVQSPYVATKLALKAAMVELGCPEFDADKHVWRGGEDPGGWSDTGALACIIHEGCGVPNEYNCKDPFAWWIDLADEVKAHCGKEVHFEDYNSCVTMLYLD